MEELNCNLVSTFSSTNIPCFVITEFYPIYIQTNCVLLALINPLQKWTNVLLRNANVLMSRESLSYMRHITLYMYARFFRPFR